MKNEEVVLKKIPLEILMETLVDLYKRGVEYIDIVGVSGEIQDTLGVYFTDEYMRKNVNFNDIEEYIKQTININLSDKDDLNQLI